MFGKKNKRRINQVDTLIGQHTVIEGDVTFSGGCHLDGKVIGNILSEDLDMSTLTVSERGSVDGELRVPNVVLNGTVIGDVHVNNHIELAANARVEGDVYYNLLEMVMGAEVNGKLIHQLPHADDAHLGLGHEQDDEEL